MNELNNLGYVFNQNKTANLFRTSKILRQIKINDNNIQNEVNMLRIMSLDEGEKKIENSSFRPKEDLMAQRSRNRSIKKMQTKFSLTLTSGFSTERRKKILEKGHTERKAPPSLYLTTYNKKNDSTQKKRNFKKNARKINQNIFITSDNLSSPFTNTTRTKITSKNFKTIELETPRPFKTERKIRTHEKRIHSRQGIYQIRKNFDKGNYNTLCKEFDTDVNSNKKFYTYFIQTYFNSLSPRVRELQEKKKHLDEEKLSSEENPAFSVKKKYDQIVNKRTGVVSIVDKANADLINFGENYLRISDVNFYNRGKEIFNKYNQVRIEAKIDTEPKKEQKNRHLALQKNEFMILKKYESIQRESFRLRNMINSMIN